MRYFADHFISIPADKMNVFLGHRSAEGGEKYEGEEDQHVARSHGGKEGTPSINKGGGKEGPFKVSRGANMGGGRQCVQL